MHIRIDITITNIQILSPKYIHRFMSKTCAVVYVSVCMSVYVYVCECVFMCLWEKERELKFAYMFTIILLNFPIQYWNANVLQNVI